MGDGKTKESFGGCKVEKKELGNRVRRDNVLKPGGTIFPKISPVRSITLE
jgi:hypothetical protein